MQPLVSVTMSAYNIEPYLRECLDCVVNQTLKDIEIICVNDGSSDGTLAILQEYAAHDSRIIIVDKQINEGLAVARNQAIDLASGKYIGFVDGDDLLDRDLFRKAYECAELNQSDLLFWDYLTFLNDKDLHKKITAPSSMQAISPTNKIALLQRPAFFWTKLIRTDILKSLAISFPKGLSRQDIPVHWKLVTQLDKIAILPERLYFYRQQPSATTYQTDWRMADLAIVMDLVQLYLHESGLYDTYKDIFLQKQLELLSGFVNGVDEHLKPKAMQWVLDRLGDDHWYYIYDKKPLRWQARDFYLTINGSLSAKIRRSFWLSARSCFRAIKKHGFH
jgi:glycosyltransferase involved in cell wall biosynthesis